MGTVLGLSPGRGFVDSRFFQRCVLHVYVSLCVQRFFKYLCIAAKVAEVVRLAKKGLSEGRCVVIGLQSTGEARTLEQLEQSNGELTGFISTAK